MATVGSNSKKEDIVRSTWIIKNFTYHMKESVMGRAPHTVVKSGGYKWELEMRSEANGAEVKVKMTCVKEGEPAGARVRFRFTYYSTRKGSEMCTFGSTSYCHPNRTIIYSMGPLSDLMDAVQEEEFNLFISFAFCAPGRGRLDKSARLYHLLHGGFYADLVLEARGGRRFKAHQSILAVSGPLLLQLGRPGRAIKIDMHPEAVASLLVYLYTGEISEYNLAHLEELLEASERFGLDSLRDWFEQELSAELMCDPSIANSFIGRYARRFELNRLRNLIKIYGTRKNPPPEEEADEDNEINFDLNIRDNNNQVALPFGGEYPISRRRNNLNIARGIIGGGGGGGGGVDPGHQLNIPVFQIPPIPPPRARRNRIAPVQADNLTSDDDNLGVAL